MSMPYLIIISIIGWGIGNVMYKLSIAHIHPFLTAAIVSVVSFVLAPLPLIVAKVDMTVDFLGVLFAVLGSLCVGIGTLGFFYALKSSGVGLITALTSVYPAITIILSAYVLKEAISLKQMVGVAFAIVSVVLLSLK